MKYKWYAIIGILATILINLFWINSIHVNSNIQTKIAIEMKSEYEGDFQLFWSDDKNFMETKSQIIDYHGEAQLKEDFPMESRYVRLDFGTEVSEYYISAITVLIDNYKIPIDFLDMEYSQLNMEINEENNAHIWTTGNDPFCIIDLEKTNYTKIANGMMKKQSFYAACSLCIVFDLLVLILFIKRKKIMCSLKEMFENKALIKDMAVNDFKTRYAGAYLGVCWAFIQPVITILVYWFVFQVGFRSGVINNVPFVLWLSAGLVPWFFFNEAMNSATSSLVEYSYLVKKVVFNINIIPVVRILSALFVHIFFVAFIAIMFIVNGLYPNIYWLQLVYYSICMILFTLGISYATSALMVFFRDLSQIVVVILQVLIWLTPIMWNFDVISPGMRWIFKINPMFYIVQGYREALIDKKWFWDNPYQTIYVWGFIVLSILIGNSVFGKLKKHMADVL